MTWDIDHYCFWDLQSAYIIAAKASTYGQLIKDSWVDKSKVQAPEPKTSYFNHLELFTKAWQKNRKTVIKTISNSTIKKALFYPIKSIQPNQIMLVRKKTMIKIVIKIITKIV